MSKAETSALPRNARRASAIEASVPRTTAPALESSGDDRARLERCMELRVREELAVPREGEAAEREGRQHRVVEREDEQDHDRRVEKDDHEDEQRSQRAASVLRQRDVHQPLATEPTWLKREKTAVSTPTTTSRKSASTDPVRQSGKAGSEEIRDLVAVHVARRAADERRGDELADGRNEHEQERRNDSGHAQRQRDAQKRLPPAGAQVACRFEEPPVEALERDEDRQRNEGEPDVRRARA